MSIVGTSLPSIQDIFTKTLHKQGLLDYKRPLPPLSWTIHPAAVWKKVPEHPGKIHQTQQQFLPPGCQTPQYPAAPEFDIMSEDLSYLKLIYL